MRQASTCSCCSTGVKEKQSARATHWRSVWEFYNSSTILIDRMCWVTQFIHASSMCLTTFNSAELWRRHKPVLVIPQVSRRSKVHVQHSDEVSGNFDSSTKLIDRICWVQLIHASSLCLTTFRQNYEAGIHQFLLFRRCQGEAVCTCNTVTKCLGILMSPQN